jgi:hypothetical protein
VAETKKRSEELAVENVRRITEVLRTERNDAIALAQVKREEAGRYRGMVKDARKLLELAQGASLPGDLGERIRAFIITLPPDTAG